MFDDDSHQPQVEMRWTLILDNAWIPDWSITYRRRDSIHELVKCNTYDWRYYKRIGWRVIRVKITLEEIKKNHDCQKSHTNRN